MPRSNFHSRLPATRTETTGALSRRERHSAEIRERLFRAALDIIARKGFAETTVEDITNAADVGKGTFFNYFPSKDHILLAFGEMQVAKLERGLQDARASKEPLRLFLRSFITRMVEEPLRNTAIIRLIFQGYLASSPIRSAMFDLQDRALALQTQIVQLGQERGEVRTDLPAVEIAHVFRQTVAGTLLLWSLRGDASLHSRIEAAFNLLWSGLAPRDAAAMPSPTPPHT